MLSLPSLECQTKCKAHVKTMALTLALLLLVIVQTQAGVIKKREIPFTLDLRPEMLLNTTTTAIAPKIDPDIGELEMKTPATITTPVLAETSTNDTHITTKLVLQPMTKLAAMEKDSMVSNIGATSKEYMINEIALNETKKMLKTAIDDDEQLNSKKETLVASNDTSKQLEESLITHAQLMEKGPINNTTDASFKVNDAVEMAETTSTSTLMAETVQATTPTLQEINIETHANVAKEAPTNLPNNDTEKFKTTANLLQANNIETDDAAADKAKTETIKDESLETNHISDVSKEPEVTTAANKEQNIFSVATNNSSTDNPVEIEISQENSNSAKIQDGLDRESLKDVSNDLPEKTTENILSTAAPLEANKLEYGRSMAMAEKENEPVISLSLNSTLPANNENEILSRTSTASPQFTHIGNNIDLEELGKSEKKPKFINDNSSNAQQMNLPNNAEVWSLAGLKSVPVFNVTMATAPKQSQFHEVAAQIESPVVNKNTTFNNSNQSEKFLLDWSHIMMDKDLATTANYQTQNQNNEVILNNNEAAAADNELAQLQVAKGQDTMTQQTPSYEQSRVEEIVTNMLAESTTIPATITANSTILSADNATDNDNKEDKHEMEMTTEPTSTSTEMTGAAKAETIVETKTSEIRPSTFTQNASSLESETKHQEANSNEINLTLNNSGAAVETSLEYGKTNNSANVDVAIKSESELAKATAVIVDTTKQTTTAKADEQISSERATTLSTLETGNANVSLPSSSSSNIEPNSIYENSENNPVAESEHETRLKAKENLQLFATSSEIPSITTYKPKHYEISQSPVNSDTNIAETTSAAVTNRIPTAEVVDQNGNEIEQNQSILLKTFETTTASSFNNISSTTKTHLNEQVLFETSTELISTTTTKTNDTNFIPNATTNEKTSEEKTTSYSKDEIIINREKEFQLEKTIAQAVSEAESTTTPKIQDNSVDNEKQDESAKARNTSDTAIGSSSPIPPQLSTTLSATFEKEQGQQEIETTTSKTSNDTPVVSIAGTNESTTTSTTTNSPIVATSTAETTKADTYFKFPISTNSNKKEQQVVETSTKTIKEDAQAIETTTMTLEPLSNAKSATTEETYINLLDDSTTTSPITTTPLTTQILTTTTTPLPPQIINTTTASGLDITTKIEEEIYKIVDSTTTETAKITAHTSGVFDEVETTTARNFPVTFSPTTTMIPAVTDPVPTVIAANIGSKSLPPVNGIMIGTSGNMYPKNSESNGETDVNVIIAITVSVIGVIALILLVAFLYLMRKRQKQTSYSQRCRPVSLDEYAIDDGSVRGSMRKSSALRSSKRTYGNLAFDDPSLRHNAMGIHDLAKFSVEKLRIFEEFRDVPQITAREDEVPQGCEDKNRYANVLPLPETRIILQRLNGDEKTEYINANYVTGPKDPPNYYIACQAPLDTTVEDFWRMIWEQQSRVIIQATDLIENGVEKCAEYLPPSVTLDNHSTFGDFQVTLQNREVKDKYAISTVLLKNTGEENTTRELTHYWYKWPETGVPVEEAPIIAMLLEARSSLISYAIEQANEDKEKSSSATLKSAEEGTVGTNVTSPTTKETGDGSSGGGNGEINGNISMVPIKKTARNQGPLTIHCSPGTGRTGTIIACDIAIRSLETIKRTVDIPHIVYHVRRGRASAVLTKEQYEFIYKVANMYGAKISNPNSYN